MSYSSDLTPAYQKSPKTWTTENDNELRFTNMSFTRIVQALTAACYRLEGKPDSDPSQIRNLIYELNKRLHVSKESRTALLFWAMAWFLDDRTESPETIDTSSLILGECLQALPYTTLALLSRKLEEALAEGV